MIHHQEMEEEMKMKGMTIARIPRTRIREVVQDLSVIRMANSQNFLLEEETETGCKNKVWIKYSKLKEINQKADIFAKNYTCCHHAIAVDLHVFDMFSSFSLILVHYVSYSIAYIVCTWKKWAQERTGCAQPLCVSVAHPILSCILLPSPFYTG